MRRLVFVILSLLLVACKDDKVDDAGGQEQQDFLLQDVPGVYLQGKPVFVYQAGEHQLVYTTDGLRCRIQTDRLDRVWAAELTEVPQTGGMVKVRITAKEVETAGGEQLCEVLKQESGKCWLWETASATGYVIKTGE